MKYTVLTRYGAMRTIGTFATDIRNLRLRDRCVVRSERGTEFGEIIAAPQRVEDRPRGKTNGAIVRRATPQDYERRKHIEEVEQPKEFALCAGKIRERGLAMRLVSTEHILGGEKIIFYFLADGRVDFRELVKDLATEYKTRIELRQIGVRDEARLLAEYEHCGRELCCRTFMKDLEPVTMRMAKLQKTTLDPAKISGRCGRLMCCLRFEDETYTELKRSLPKKGTRVRLESGPAEVISSEILAQTVRVELPDRRTVKIGVSEILEILPDEEPAKASRTPRKPEAKGKAPVAEGERPARPRRRSGSRGRRRRGGSKPSPDRAPATDKPAPSPPADGPAPPRPAAEAKKPEAQRGDQQRSGRRPSRRRGRGSRGRGSAKPGAPAQPPTPESSAKSQPSPKPEQAPPTPQQKKPPEPKADTWAPDEWWEGSDDRKE